MNVRTEESSMTNSWENDSFDTFTDGDYDSDGEWFSFTHILHPDPPF